IACSSPTMVPASRARLSLRLGLIVPPQADAERPSARAKHTTRAFALAEGRSASACGGTIRSEEHTSELQSRSDLGCRLLLENRKEKTRIRDCTRHRRSTPGTPGPREDSTDAAWAGYCCHTTSRVWAGFDCPRTLYSGARGSQ